MRSSVPQVFEGLPKFSSGTKVHAEAPFTLFSSFINKADYLTSKDIVNKTWGTSQYDESHCWVQ